MNKRLGTSHLERLRGSLSRLSTHLAWLELKEGERRPGDPPALSMNPGMAADIRNETSRFMATAAAVHEFLNEHQDHGLSEARCQVWREDVLRLEAEFQNLRLPKPF